MNLKKITINHPDLGQVNVNASDWPTYKEQGAKMVGAEDDEEEEEEEANQYDFAAHTLPQLRKMADVAKIDHDDMKKDDLVAALLASGYEPE